ncbi:glutathione S-transferase family protein [Sphingoaurantiacus capsulatus]|uniref:Glutathione S-transferase family protein n=1 Tax=Sphingoaurantiacus capsulatus TaxID=1771310 RepID=A0ABV7XCW2_9SPHN
MTTIIGNYVSPYVRKVLVVLGLKGVPYRIDPLVPFFATDDFLKLSPLRRIPVLIDDQVTLTDSTVVNEYLDERYPAPPLMPAAPADRAKARWIEEFADTRLCDLLIWGLFFQQAIKPAVLGEATDADKVAQILETDLPAAMDYLETQAPADGFLFGDQLSLADIALVAPFKNALFVRWRPDTARWPKMAGLIARAFAHPAFKALEPFETLCLKTPPKQQRAGLADLGAALSEVDYGGDTPRRGVMTLG